MNQTWLKGVALLVAVGGCGGPNPSFSVEGTGEGGSTFSTLCNGSGTAPPETSA